MGVKVQLCASRGQREDDAWVGHCVFLIGGLVQDVCCCGRQPVHRALSALQPTFFSAALDRFAAGVGGHRSEGASCWNGHPTHPISPNVSCSQIPSVFSIVAATCELSCRLLRGMLSPTQKLAYCSVFLWCPPRVLHSRVPCRLCWDHASFVPHPTANSQPQEQSFLSQSSVSWSNPRPWVKLMCMLQVPGSGQQPDPLDATPGHL